MLQPALTAFANSSQTSSAVVCWVCQRREACAAGVIWIGGGIFAAQYLIIGIKEPRKGKKEIF